MLNDALVRSLILDSTINLLVTSGLVYDDIISYYGSMLAYMISVVLPLPASLSSPPVHSLIDCMFFSSLGLFISKSPDTASLAH